MITPEKQTIEQILSGTRVKFSVPNYQRSFDWGRSELQELMDDLKDVKETDDNDLFLGNFIFDVSDSTNYKIVDGQQRLTTISLIFIAIREHAKKIQETEIANEIQDYISIYSSVRNKNEIKFSVSENIKVIFDEMSAPNWNGTFPEKVNGKSVKRQNNKVKPIYKFIVESISTFNSEELRKFISALWDTYVIVIKVENNQDVFSVFERTNARGLDLNIGDLLKNYIFSHQEYEFEQKWSEIVDNANGSLPRMLKYFWISRKGYIQQSKLYKSLKQYVKEIDSESQEGIQVFVGELYLFSRFYKTLQSQDPEVVKDWLNEFGLVELSKNESYYHRINRVFQALKLFRVTQAYPIIYSILTLFKNDDKAKEKKLFMALENIEKYHFVNNVISGRVGHEVEKFYAETAAKIFNSVESFNNEIDQFLQDLSKKKSLREEFTSNFIDTVIYSSKNISLINYVFDRINNYEIKGGQVQGSQYVPIFSPEKDLSKRNYNIEHFLAQNLKENYDEQELEQFDRIGNLLVISRHTNSLLSDKSPLEKIEIIKSDRKHFGNLRYIDDFINKYDEDFKNWGLDTIEKRSNDMAEIAYLHIWKF